MKDTIINVRKYRNEQFPILNVTRIVSADTCRASNCELGQEINCMTPRELFQASILRLSPTILMQSWSHSFLPKPKCSTFYSSSWHLYQECSSWHHTPGHKTWWTQAWSDLKASYLRTSFYRIGRHYASFQEREQPTVLPSCNTYKSQQWHHHGKLSLRVQKWLTYLVSNQQLWNWM